MPLYEYKCLDCEAILEILVTGEEPTHCGSSCRPSAAVRWYGKGRLQRLISTPADLNKISRPDRPRDKDIANTGFTKYVKDDDGSYRKVAGRGPELPKKSG